MIIKHNLNAKTTHSSMRKYCILSIVLVLLLNIFVYFHAGLSIINFSLIVFFIVFYFKNIKRSNTRKSVSFSYTVSMILCGAFSILMFALLIIAIILSVTGNLDINKLLSTI